MPDDWILKTIMVCGVITMVCMTIVMIVVTVALVMLAFKGG